MSKKLVFEKAYSLLHEIPYSVDGNFKKTKNVILKALTVKSALRFEEVAREGNIAALQFLAENELIISASDKAPITDLSELHYVAAQKLSADYTKFFLNIFSFFETPEKEGDS